MFFSLGRLVLYTVFMVFPLPETLVKTLAKNLVKTFIFESFQIDVYWFVLKNMMFEDSNVFNGFALLL